MIYDLIIIGLGPAGISAAIYAKRSNLNVLCLEASAPGGLLNKINKIDNYLGFKEISGPDLAFQMFEQLSKHEIPYKIQKVTSINKKDNIFINTEKEEYETTNLIIATGRNSKKLGLNNEKKFIGKGLSYCAVCDAALYKGKTVAVTGIDDTAIEEAIYMADIVDKVHFIHKGTSISNNEELLTQLNNKTNIEIHNKSTITELIGTESLEQIKLNDNKLLTISCLFTYEGYEPHTDIFSSLNITDNSGYIIVDDKGKTSVDNIYAIGDATKKQVYQIVTAASEGAISALEVVKNIKKQ